MTSSSKNKKRKSSSFLPTYFQTTRNENFLTTTLDQLYQEPALTRINGFVGSKLSPTYNSLTDNYISNSAINDNELRTKYPLQPALTLKDSNGNLKSSYCFDDLVNQLSWHGAPVQDYNRLFQPDINSYDPHINWDKFINFRQYYWLPMGPDPVKIAGLKRQTVSTYSVTDSPDKSYFIFTPDGVTEDPILTLYRGMTYVFNVNSSNNFYIKTTNTSGPEDSLTGAGVKNGQITLTIQDTFPSQLYYVSDNNTVVDGIILVKNILDNSSIDVEQEIIGKVTYTSGNDITLINGLMINFAGNVTPSYYQNRNFIVEGVGESIKLVNFDLLQTPETLATQFDDNFDANLFDEYPFDSFKNLPLAPEYITINRSSKDLNPWSRYNRWFHIDVLNASAKTNNVVPVYPNNLRASRPIIEFDADLKLYNFGNDSLPPIDLIDFSVPSAFGIVEGSLTYTIDGRILSPGQKIIFNADNDPLVKGKVFEVTLSSINGVNKINLVNVTEPVFGNTVVITDGLSNKGKEYWFNGAEWVLSQQRTKLNQAPLFDLFDDKGISYSNKNYYDSIFSGNKLFGYKIGNGSNDPVLGFPLSYMNVGVEGSYLFQNYFNTDTITLLFSNNVRTILTSQTFLLKSNKLINIWTKGETNQLAVQQFQAVDNATKIIPITVYDNSGLIKDLKLNIFVNNTQLKENIDYRLEISNSILNVVLTNNFTTLTNVLINCYSSQTPNSTGVYETPVNLTNNPLNGSITQFTLSELSNHVQSMVLKDPEFKGNFPGNSNLKDLPNITKYGSRLITINNPLSFAHLYITDRNNNLIDSIKTVSQDYFTYKFKLIDEISKIEQTASSDVVLDQALSNLNLTKNSSFPYSQSDMLGFGNNCVRNNFTVTDVRNKSYPLTQIFDINSSSFKSVLVYLNSVQLYYGIDYVFDINDPYVIINKTISVGDQIKTVEYINTVGSYVPPTPTKQGLYPKYKPELYVDYSFVDNPQVMLQGHDGSQTVAFTLLNDFSNGNYDFRDLALLEFEKRIFNNLKVEYNLDLFDINKLLPSAFRKTDYSYNEVYDIVKPDFLKWTSNYNLDYQTNLYYNSNNHQTFNFKNCTDYISNAPFVAGNWRGIFKYYFDTDRPNTHPWEMLGFTVQPDWWVAEYGPAPYTAGNLNLWQDLEAGLIRYGSRAGIDKSYARPSLSQIIPVDDSGNLIDLINWGGIKYNGYIPNPSDDYQFGDYGPVEASYRRSSMWPFELQIIAALCNPANYAAKMFDPMRLQKDSTGQYRYGASSSFLNPTFVMLYSDTDSAGNIIWSSGYSAFVIEAGKKKNINYLTNLKQDLSTVDFNLSYKSGGFLSKDKLDIIIDSVNPNSINPGVLLPNEDYSLLFSTSNPIKTVSISGIIVEKRDTYFTVRGYDKATSYFNVTLPLHRTNDSAITVGGKSSPFLLWTEDSYYKAGQVVKYQDNFYNVISSGNSGKIFNTLNYSKLPSIPVYGGATVLTAIDFESQVTEIKYGSKFETIQEVYDVIIGYGNWLITQGFEFDQYSSDLGVVVDWYFSGKEFLYWTTQNWASGSVITLSPFANYLKYNLTDSTVDNLLNSNYDYLVAKSDGHLITPKNLSISRANNQFTISNIYDGMYFVSLNLVQKEHIIVMNNESMFGDIIYDIETGYRQFRIKLIGFITSDWTGDFLSSGFIYDEANIRNWEPYVDYNYADIVKYFGNYYSANQNISGSEMFNNSYWTPLLSKPTAQLLPNFEYKITQFEDFYSLDIDNFDSGQQKMAQHLTGYTPRSYLTNIIEDPIAQYKFYQGFIKEKGTANSIYKLAKASVHNLQGNISFNEEWALRVGYYGGFNTFNELELPLRESDFSLNNQIIEFVTNAPVQSNDFKSYILPSNLSLIPEDYSSDNTFYTKSSTFNNNSLVLPMAGYVRTDDITSTAYSIDSLFDIANLSLINDGDTFWIGFTRNGGWDVLRYTKQTSYVINSYVSSPSYELTFETNISHNLSVGDIISVYGLDNGTDGIYVVQSVPEKTSFTVSTQLTSSSAPATSAILYKFMSVRFDSFDSLVNSKINFKLNDIIWADNGSGVSADSKWQVYKNINNYKLSTEILNGASETDQHFGYAMANRENSDYLIVSSPQYYTPVSGQGLVYVYNNVLNQNLKITASFSNSSTYVSTVSNFGYSLSFDDDNKVIVTGSPGSNSVQFNYVDGTWLGNITEYQNADTGYGSTVLLSDKVNPITGNKVLLVAAPTTGTVFSYEFSADITNTSSSISIINEYTFNVGATTHISLASSADGSVVAFANPYGNGSRGIVYCVFDNNVIANTLIPGIVNNSKFGYNIELSNDGQFLFVSAIDFVYNNKTGVVFVYKKNKSSFNIIPYQIIENPSDDPDLHFGAKIKVDNSGTLYVSSLSVGSQQYNTSFDSNFTTFDGLSTNFYDDLHFFGTVYSFERKGNYYVKAHEFFDETVLNLINGIPESGPSYGSSLAVSKNGLFVGAYTLQPNNGALYQFTKIDSSAASWNLLRQQDDLVDLSAIKKVYTIDSVSQNVLDYLDVYDPAKGKILGITDQELKYKTAFDPAVYSVGNQGVNVDTNISWVEDHVGELWWDLSTVKYMWYEQGEAEYRNNTWGSIFPGASIDVYEWVRTAYLPSEWSALADTAEGLAVGISGQPKYPDNSIISVKQSFDSSTGVTSNVYFYWVRNSVLVPSVNNRKISASSVASIIYNPASSGNKYISVLSKNALSAVNLKQDLVSNNIYLNISTDNNTVNVNKHTEWLLMREGDAESQPTILMNKKLIDSLVGKDTLGNLVPDPLLSDREKYGISFRPRQTMFINREEALRNLFEYVNQICSQNLISYSANFANLNSKEEIPPLYSQEYDAILSTYDELLQINVKKISQASLTCNVTNGFITSVNIVNSGSNYGNLLESQYLDSNGNKTWIGPSVTIANNISNAKITTFVNSSGNLTAVQAYVNGGLTTVDAIIENAGNGFTDTPALTVRPFTVIVQSDYNSNNYWAKYQIINKKWVKVHTQDYDTTQYWRYVDWTSNNFDSLKSYKITVNEPYQLNSITTLNVGDYVKILNQGNGKSIILEKVSSNGTYNTEYDLVLSEKATIEFLGALWNIKNNPYNYDNVFTYDQTLYDQTPETELRIILSAIKDDIFTGSLKVYWNYVFFKCLKYALNEQKFVDYAFKTAFINVKNLAGDLDQRSVYKFQNSSYFEQYIEEVKPYHTNIRNYQVNYNLLDNSNSFSTDFDSPSYYNESTLSYQTADNNNELLLQYPWKSWNNNKGLSVIGANISDSGNGYTAVPTVMIIPANGDTGSGATAEAYISLGKVTEIVVTNPGSGYTKTPTIELVGGGSTNLTPAKVYPLMSNSLVRSNSVEMKFDRISPTQTITTSTVNDLFYFTKNNLTFELSWASTNKKSDINVLVYNTSTITTSSQGYKVLASDYDISTVVDSSVGYHKLKSYLTLHPTDQLKSILKYSSSSIATSIVSINYNKNINLYHAVDRINNYYNPQVGMPGNDLSQLMAGIELPIPQYQGLPFDYTTNWDPTGSAPYGSQLFEDDVLYSTNTTVVGYNQIGTNTLYVSSTDNISVGYHVNSVVVSTGTFTTSVLSKFDANNVYVVSVNTNSVTLNTVTNEAIGYTTNSGVVSLYLWQYNTTPGVLDTILQGGDLTTATDSAGVTVFATARGISPSDTIVDGDAFVTTYTSNSPEEYVKGETFESLGISVYTKSTNTNFSPIIYSLVYEMAATTGTTVISLPVDPPNDQSVIVSVEGATIPPSAYTIDYTNRLLIINPIGYVGTLGVTIVGVGGNQFISYDYTTAVNTTTVSVRVGALNNYQSVYVSLDGHALSPSEYTVSAGRVIVSNLTLGDHTLQAYTFASSNNQFSTVNEQGWFFDGATYNHSVIYPGKLWSPNAQAIVEVNGQRLIPPSTVYYSVINGQTLFAIDPNDNYSPGLFDQADIEVYRNGYKLKNGVDFVIPPGSNSVLFKSGFLSDNDVIAITHFVFSQYYFSNNKIYFTNVTFTYLDYIIVYTFTDGDNSFIREETYQARPSHTYPLGRQLLSSKYVWVSVGKQVLINGVDYSLDVTGTQVVIRDDYPYNSEDIITIFSMSDSYLDKNSLGYRLFIDMFGRKQFKRISKNNTTYLAQPLYSTSTYIDVVDSALLFEPDLVKKIPGVILINGERIEYFSISGNRLGTLRRGTLGTGPKDVYLAGTAVIDQSYRQNAPYNDSYSVTTTYITSELSNSYNISGINFDNNVINHQLNVYYGGKMLSNAGKYVFDNSYLYDPVPTNIVGSVSTISNLTTTTDMYTAYFVTTTNQVWVYTNSTRLDATNNGYIFSGVTYQDPDYYINNVVSNTATIVLNTLTVSLTTGTEVKLVQGYGLTKTSSNTTNLAIYNRAKTSLINNNSIFAVFLQEQPTSFPDKYYYGQF